MYDWLINSIPEPVRKNVGDFKDKVLSPFNTNTPKHIMYWKEKNLNKPKLQKQFEENKINSIRNPFILKQEKRKSKEEKEIKDRIIKDGIIRTISALFEQEDDDYYKPKRVGNFCNNNYVEYESKVIEIKTF